MKKTIYLAILLSLVGVSPVFAFKMPGVAQLKGIAQGSASSADAGDLVIDKYVGAVDEFTKAEVASLEAFGLKTEAEQYLAEAKQFTKGNINKDSKVIEAQLTRSSNANKAVSDKMNSGAVLSEEGKTKLVESLGYFAKGIVLEGGVGLELTSAVSETQGQVTSISSNPAGILQLGNIKSKLNTLLFLTKSVPSDLVQKKNLLSNYAAYCKAQGIEVPADVTNAFK